MRHVKSRIVPGLVVLILLTGCAFFVIQGKKPSASLFDAEGSREKLERILLSLDGLSEDHYKKYLSQYEQEEYRGEALVYSLEGIEEEKRTIGSGGPADFSVEITDAGLYAVGFDYQCTGDNILQTSISMKVNGEFPYGEMEHLFFADTWKSGEIQLDRYGNECVAMPEKEKVWAFTYLHDTAFLQNDPLLIYFEEGENTLTLQANEGSVLLKTIRLSSPDDLVSPDAVSQEAGGMPQGAGGAYLEVEAETMVRRNLANIRTEAVFDPMVTPYDPYIKLQNVVAETSYRVGGSSMDYVINVEEEGYYYFAFDYLQSQKKDFSVYRNLYVDGRIPSESYENIPFSYTLNYRRSTVEVPVYLSAGTHTLTLEVALEPYGDAITVINEIIGRINELALSVNKIIGGNADKYRDFALEEYGLDIRGDLNHWADILEEVYNALAEGDAYGTRNGQIRLLDVSVQKLRELAEEPNQLPQNLSRFSYGDSSIRQYLSTVAENLGYGDLSLDKFYVYRPGARLPKPESWLKRQLLNLRHLAASFVQDDYAPGYEDEEMLEVWVNRPRQYLEIIQRMVDTDFTRKTGVKVNVSIVPDQQKLILANASGKAPDAAIGISSGLVYDLALRKALVNLREFDNFSGVGKRFAPGMLIPLACDDGIYGLPETFNFYALFYRTDIFEKLNLNVPDNMEKVRELLPELARQGLSFNLHTANLPKTTFAATAPFVLQNGGDLFAGDDLAVHLDSEEVIGGMKVLTDNFTVYDMDYEILNFYQSFRDGRTPIGISNYGTYNLLINAAPELNGCWDIALYPGLIREDGTVDRSMSGAAESCVIFSSTEKKEQAWVFLDWWMSDEVQTEFAFILQATLGNEYMWNSANLNAIAAAPWSTKHKDVILEQLTWSNDIPRVPGSYMIERELGNIVVDVVTNDENLRTAIDTAQKRVNAEFDRKLEEFGYTDSRGRPVRELIIPDKEMIEGWLK